MPKQYLRKCFPVHCSCVSLKFPCGGNPERDFCTCREGGQQHQAGMRVRGAAIPGDWHFEVSTF